ncbi:hypothetical protein KDK82_4162 [Delftia sp. K82]|nr:hypothetical protein KDK82_4162 [Delftia sp. K82]
MPFQKQLDYVAYECRRELIVGKHLQATLPSLYQFLNFMARSRPSPAQVCKQCLTMRVERQPRFCRHNLSSRSDEELYAQLVFQALK